ncbi:MAG: ATP-binding cassette domain-containing protein [Bacilli bacterium]|nr:ATP-binding cassette domain-containing protein [Bacilli bacterium]
MIKLSKIGKKYKEGDSEKWVLKDISLILPSKGLVAIQGESGSGKSTLLNLISMMEKPDEGVIKINGRNVEKLSEKEKEDFRFFECGFIFQHFNLFEDVTAKDNIVHSLLMGGVDSKTAKDKANTLLKEYKLEHLANKKTSVLSGGEKQRIAILRTIIRSPRIILADEPTGALDEKNEKAIMKMLKEYSKENLVVFVSHNERIIKKYSDRILKIRNGGISDDSKILRKADPEPMAKRKRGNSSRWIIDVTRGHFKKDIKRNALSFAGTLISFFGILISLGFYSSSKDTIEKEKKKSLLYTSASVSLVQEEEIEGSPLTLNRTRRPIFGDLERALDGLARIECDYSYFIPSYSAYTFNGEKKDPVSFAPISDITLKDRHRSMLLEGDPPRRDSLEFVLVNKEFADLFSESVLNHKIEISNSVKVLRNNIEDSLDFSFEFYIGGVVDEFSFLNSPRVYYSLNAIKANLSSLKLENISKAEGSNVDALSLVEECAGDSPYGSYAYSIFFSEDNAPAIERLMHELDKGDTGLKITSQSFDVIQSFSTLVDAFTACLVPFLILALVSSFAITCFTSYSSYLSKRKEFAIMHALGARSEDVSNINLLENVGVSILSGISALALAFPLSRLFSIMLDKRVHIANLVTLKINAFNVPFFPILVILIFSLVFPLFGSAIPQFVFRKQSLVKELSDE